jgi:hypothetical protein
MYEDLSIFERALARFGDKVVSLPDLKSWIRSRQKMLINKSRNFTENLRNSVKKKEIRVGTLQTRTKVPIVVKRNHSTKRTIR